MSGGMPLRVRNLVVDERGFVLAQAHFGNAVVELFAGLFGFCQRIFWLLLIVDVDFCEALAGAGAGVEDIKV